MSWNKSFSEGLVKMAMVRPESAKMLAKLLLVVIAKRDKGSASVNNVRQALISARNVAKNSKKK